MEDERAAELADDEEARALAPELPPLHAGVAAAEDDEMTTELPPLPLLEPALAVEAARADELEESETATEVEESAGSAEAVEDDEGDCRDCALDEELLLSVCPLEDDETTAEPVLPRAPAEELDAPAAPVAAVLLLLLLLLLLPVGASLFCPELLLTPPPLFEPELELPVEDNKTPLDPPALLLDWPCEADEEPAST